MGWWAEAPRTLWLITLSLHGTHGTLVGKRGMCPRITKSELHHSNSYTQKPRKKYNEMWIHFVHRICDLLDKKSGYYETLRHISSRLHGTVLFIDILTDATFIRQHRWLINKKIASFDQVILIKCKRNCRLIIGTIFEFIHLDDTTGRTISIAGLTFGGRIRILRKQNSGDVTELVLLA